VNYLLHTNACIALINGKPTAVRARFQRALGTGSQAMVSAVAVFELWYGVAKSVRQEMNAKRLETFLAGPLRALAIEEEDAQFAGAIRATMEAAGKPIGAYDLLIAGQALRRGLTLVTANTREFARIKDLLWEDWAKR
jgi:tRNA(fMet)-specific endonuclease VapC